MPKETASDLLTTEKIDSYLKENHLLMQSILQYQNSGQLYRAVQLQKRLQNNLLYLAAISDNTTN